MAKQKGSAARKTTACCATGTTAVACHAAVCVSSKVYSSLNRRNNTLSPFSLTYHSTLRQPTVGAKLCPRRECASLNSVAYILFNISF